MDNSDKIILDLCGGTGAWSKPYEDNGYDVRIITLPEHDVLKWGPPEEVYGILAAPPCTDFTILKIHQENPDSLKIVCRCIQMARDTNPVFWALENPTGYLRKYLQNPVYTFHPWEFGDPWTKRTDLWGAFYSPEKIYTLWDEVPKNEALYVRPGRSKPSIALLHKSAMADIEWMKDYKVENDASFRAITPQGFARAFYEANK